ncbi:hypothetical protein LTR33_007033 [Friedmanniomyces endolithicus]|nr:hypothetical protein LTR33_007033 [Friedmanniomyces endolithicus]
MSSTKTLDVLYTTAEIVWASSAYPIVNLCSTIWDDYAPALMVPADLLSVNLVTELGGGGFCTFSVNEANVFFDPPKALSQMTAAAGPSSPLLPATTTMQTPSITAEPAGSVSAPSVTITGVGVSDTVTSAGADPQTSSKAVESTSYPAQDTSSVSIVDPTVATPAASARSSSAVESASGGSQGMGSEQLPAPTQADPSTPTGDSPYLSEVISEDSTTTPPGTDGAAYESTTASSTFTTMISSEDPGSSPHTTAIAPILTSPDVAPAGSAAAQPPRSTDGIAGAIASILAIPPPSSTPTTPTPVTVYTSSDDTSTPQSSTQSSAAILVDPAGPIISVLAGLGSSLSIKAVTVSAGMEIASTTATSPSTPPLPAIVWTASNGREYTLPTIPSENSPMSSGALATPIGMAGQASTTGATTYDSTSMTETEDPVPPPSSRTTNPVGGLGNIVAALSSIAASEATPTNSALTALQTETSGTLSSSQSRGGGEMPTAAGSPGNSFLPSFVPSGSAITKSGLTRPLASSESHALTDGASRASSTGTDAGGAVASGTGTSGSGVGGSAGGSGVPSAGCRGGGSGWWMALVGLSVLLYWY